MNRQDDITQLQFYVSVEQEVWRKVREAQVGYITQHHRQPTHVIIGAAWFPKASPAPAVANAYGLVVIVDNLNLERIEVIG